MSIHGWCGFVFVISNSNVIIVTKKHNRRKMAKTTRRRFAGEGKIIDSFDNMWAKRKGYIGKP